MPFKMQKNTGLRIPRIPKIGQYIRDISLKMVTISMTFHNSELLHHQYCIIFHLVYICGLMDYQINAQSAGPNVLL